MPNRMQKTPKEASREHDNADLGSSRRAMRNAKRTHYSGFDRDDNVIGMCMVWLGRRQKGGGIACDYRRKCRLNPLVGKRWQIGRIPVYAELWRPPRVRGWPRWQIKPLHL